MAAANKFEEAVIGKLGLEIKELEEIHGYEKSHFNIIKKYLENEVAKKNSEINN